MNFRTVDDALRFAFSHPHGGIGRPLVNRMADGPRRIGDGLGAFDLAGQAGMVLGALRSLGETFFAIGAARHLSPALPCPYGSSCCSGWKRNRDWTAAIETLTYETSRALPHRRILHGVRYAVVARYFGERDLTDTDLARRFKVDRGTVATHGAAVDGYLRDHERQMRSDLMERLGIGTQSVALAA